MDVSDLSQEPIGGTEPATVTCLFEDGRRRVCTITAAEAEHLAEAGRDATKIRSRVWFRLRLVALKLAPWVAGLVIGSLVLPALTKQWADRQGVLAIKQEINSDISSRSVAAYSAGYRAVQAPRTGVSKNRAAEDAWDASVGAISGRLEIYFPQGDTTTRWYNFSDAVRKYIDLGFPYGTAERILTAVRHYVEKHSTIPVTKGDWDILRRCHAHKQLKATAACLAEDSATGAYGE